MATKKEIKAQEKAEAIAELRRLGVKPGKTLLTNVVQVSRSGMSRQIKVYLVRKDEMVNVTRLVGEAIGERYSSKSNALVVEGCGMDMCWHTIYRLGRVMFPNGGSLEHSPRKHQEMRAGATKETDGGYLLVNQTF